MIQLFAGMRRAHLGADPGLALGHDGEEEADRVDAFFQQSLGKTLCQRRVIQHHRTDGVHARLEVEAGLGHALAEVGGVLAQALAQLAGFAQHLERLGAGGGHVRRQRIGEQIGPRALAQQFDDFCLAGGEAAERAAHRLAEGAGDDVDLVQHALDLGAAPAGVAEEAGGVAFVDVHQRAVFFRQRGDLIQRGDEAVHREHAVGGDQNGARAVGLGLLELLLQIGHVAVGVAIPLGLAQTHAVDDRGVVEGVGDDRVVLVQQWFEQAAVGIEAGGVEDGVVLAEEGRDRLLQFLVQILRAADEAHRGHAETVAVQRGLGGSDDVRVVGQTQVIIGAEVQHRAAIGQGDLGRLRAGDDALGLEQAGGADFVEGVGVTLGEGHGGSGNQEKGAVRWLSVGDLRRHGCRRRAYMDVFTACRALRASARHPARECANQFQLSTTLPALPASIRSKPFWKSSIGNWWVSTLPSGKPDSTSWVILYQVSYILRP